MEHISSALPWTYDELREAAYRVSRRREAVSVALLEATLMLTNVWGATYQVMPGHDPVTMWLAAFCLCQDVLFECLWPTRVVRSRSLLYAPAAFIALIAYKWPNETLSHPSITSVLIMIALSGSVILVVAICKWPVRRTAKQLAVDKWIAKQRRDLKKARLEAHEDVLGVATSHGGMRLKRIGQYVLIGHGLIKLCDIALLEEASIDPVEPMKNTERRKVTYTCGRYTGTGKTTQECLDRLQTWKEASSCSGIDIERVERDRVGYFRFLEDDIEHPWGL